MGEGAYWGRGCDLITREAQSAMNASEGPGLKSQLGHLLPKSSSR